MHICTVNKFIKILFKRFKRTLLECVRVITKVTKWKQITFVMPRVRPDHSHVVFIQVAYIKIDRIGMERCFMKRESKKLTEKGKNKQQPQPT